MSSSSSNSSTGDSSSDEPFDLPVATQTLPTLQVQSLRIRDHVLITLDYEKENYGLWRRQFLSALAKFGLTDHVDGSPAQATSDWALNDFAVLSWYNATVTPSTLEIVQERKNSAYTIWRSLRSLFRSNRDARITYLLDEFHSFLQGDLSVVEYTSRLKQMADTLRDLGHRIKDRDLVHNVLRGLDERFQHAVPHMTSGRRPSFIKLRSFLQLEEQRLSRQARVAARTALIAQASAYYAARPPAPAPAPAPASFNPALLGPLPHAAGSSAGSSGARGRPKKRKANPAGPGGSSSGGVAPAGLLPGPRPPTTVAGTFQGILGARPPAPTLPQAHQATTVASPSPQWDQAALIAALNQMALHPPSAPGGEWVLDSGASSHMSSGSGSGHKDGASPM
ncbi:vasodilator-stimulated phosphoprotein-like [Triticum aestivum]|uniref:vasodilator-stimulated phosphoprotein-like n=1 Tax=Triticum aestivum TaxID=4565 RepID=UPI001D030D60|nr:vasodilator-stimulated phosphoprotein-like [Triticum aestivum]XP_044323308.1 vasodilator-stimulated phosphoprotein-like [Triticum aestivum]XP_044409854.1 vasodilator-stimulated phosphoprotein-like [Triticum aestivum]